MSAEMNRSCTLTFELDEGIGEEQDASVEFCEGAQILYPVVVSSDSQSTLEILSQMRDQTSILTVHSEAIKKILEKQESMDEKVGQLDTVVKANRDILRRHGDEIRGLRSKQDQTENRLKRLERKLEDKAVPRSDANYGKRGKEQPKNKQGNDRVICESCGSTVARSYLPTHLKTKKCRAGQQRNATICVELE